MGSKENFIEKIAPYVQKHAPKYGISCCSAVIAQACLESAYGTSGKAKHNNFFGLKYREDRVPCASGYFTDGSSEQLQNGKYVKISAKWFEFESVDKGVEGYFQFIDIPNYKNLKGVTDPDTYLKRIRADRYATSLNYYRNCIAIVKNYGLTKYDRRAKEEADMSTPKITKMISKYNYSSRYESGIKYIVIHYTGNRTDTAKANANYFSGGNRGASAHYFVDKTSIYQSVEDKNAAWHVGVNYGKNNLFGKCTNRNSIGIEMCSNSGKVADETYKKTVELTKYLMKKYAVPEARVVRHFDVCSKICPGWKGWITSDHSIWDKFKKDIKTGDTTKTETVKVKNTNVAALQEALNVSYELDLTVNGEYDKDTQKVVSDNYLWYNKKKAIVNVHVSWLQDMLHDKGYKIDVDGSFGPESEKILKKFQKDAGIQVDGKAGRETHRKLLE